MHGKTAETNPGSRVPSLSRTWSPIMNQVDFRLFLLLISDLNVYINVQTLKVRHFSNYIEFYISGRQAQLSSFQRSGNIQGVQATGLNLECMVLRLGFVGLSRETYLELLPPPIHRRAMFQQQPALPRSIPIPLFLGVLFFLSSTTSRNHLLYVPLSQGPEVTYLHKPSSSICASSLCRPRASQVTLNPKP